MNTEDNVGHTKYELTAVSVFSGEGPPVPIPNTVVKITCADNTWLETAREDRAMLTPGGNIQVPPSSVLFLLSSCR